MSELQEANPGSALPYRLVKLVLAPKSRESLHRRIENRFHKMLEQGFEREVSRLLQIRNLTPDLPSMRSVGYRQMLRYLLGELNREEMVEKAIIATRQLAKRQYTWLNSEPDCCRLDENTGNLVQQALQLSSQRLALHGVKQITD